MKRATSPMKNKRQETKAQRSAGKNNPEGIMGRTLNEQHTKQFLISEGIMKLLKGGKEFCGAYCIDEETSRVERIIVVPRRGRNIVSDRITNVIVTPRVPCKGKCECLRICASQTDTLVERKYNPPSTTVEIWDRKIIYFGVCVR